MLIFAAYGGHQKDSLLIKINDGCSTLMIAEEDPHMNRVWRPGLLCAQCVDAYLEGASVSFPCQRC